VQAAGSRRGGDIHRQNVIVQIGLSTEVRIELSVGKIKGTVTSTDGSPSQDLRGQIFILPGQTEVPADLRAFSRDNTLTRITVSDGKFESEELSIGPALLVLRISGRKETSSQIQIQAGADTQVTLEAGVKVGEK
jgi:hypothetical protein